MTRLRLTDRQWKIYLAVWLSVLAAAAGGTAGLVLPRLFERTPAAVLAGGVVMPAGSVAAPGFTLRDPEDRAVSLSDFRGQVVALTFLDTQCQNLCPLQARFLGDVESQLRPGTPFTVVVVSVRPEVDTAATITAFARDNGLARYAWLSAPRAQLSSVWSSYGVDVLAQNADLAHSSVIYLIDRRGYERVGFLDVPEAGPFKTDVGILATT